MSLDKKFKISQEIVLCDIYMHLEKDAITDGWIAITIKGKNMAFA